MTEDMDILVVAWGMLAVPTTGLSSLWFSKPSTAPCCAMRCWACAPSQCCCVASPASRWWGLSRWVVAKADLTSTPPMLSTRRLQEDFNVVPIATCAPDAVLAAVHGVDLELYVSGVSRKLDLAAAQSVLANVHFTGLLDEAEYWRLLQTADAVIDLTLMDNCLVCGAYEALAVRKPMFLSNNLSGMELFGASVPDTDNRAGDIRRSPERQKGERAHVRAAAVPERIELAASRVERARDLADILRRWYTDERCERVL